jgi:hypothetical protein
MVLAWGWVQYWIWASTFPLTPEIGSRYLYQGTWHYTNLLTRLDANLNIKLGKKIALFGGPALNFYYTQQQDAVKGYALAKTCSTILALTNATPWWIGWNVGFNLF